MSMPEVFELAAGDLRLGVAPALGGTITAFWSNTAAGPLHWLRPAGPAALAQWNPRLTAAYPLVPFSNRVRAGRFSFDGQDVALGINPPETRHALHGQGWQRPWSLVRSAATEILLELVHLRDAWPFHYLARQQLTLTDQSLTATISITNADTRPMPAGLGHHPYWPRTPDCRITAGVTGMWETDEEVMPVALRTPPPPDRDLARGFRVDSLAIDNTFTGWDGQAVIEWPERRARVVLTADPPLRTLVAYTPAGADYFAFEPVSHITDGLNLMSLRDDTGIVVLAPGETASATFRLRPEMG